MTAPTFTSSGNKATTNVQLDSSVFGIETKNTTLLKQAYEMYLANGRINLARTKTRGLVRGGGKKPWKQKGTGRARFGSTRNPIWRGGGIAFGPTGIENYSKKLPLKSKRLAMTQALSLAAKEGRIKVVDTMMPLDGKTKAAAEFFTKIEAKGTVLCVVNTRDAKKEQSARNLPGLKLAQATNLNVYDVMNADQLVMNKDALKLINEWLGNK